MLFKEIREPGEAGVARTFVVERSCTHEVELRRWYL
jgi:hypothetical protein